MHPLFLEPFVDERQCDLFIEAKAANRPAHLRGSVGGRIRRTLSGPRERDPSTIYTCA